MLGKKKAVKSLREYIRESITPLPTIYCDMDGVLVDWYKGADKALVKHGLPKWQDSYWDQYPGEKGQAIRWEVLNRESKFWVDLEFIPGAQQLWKFIFPYHPHILSHASEYSPTAVVQKHQWLANHLRLNNNANIHIVLKRADKQRFAINNGRPNVLIDDFAKNCNEWKAAGGIAILHTSVANTVSQLKKLGFK